MAKGGARKAAQIAGQEWYFTGVPCVNGHVAKRTVNNRSCQECNRMKDRRRYARDPAKERERSRKIIWKRKNISPTRPCPDRCEMCGGLPTKRGLHLDHDHKDNRFRGWLCHYCNTNLGRFGDSIAGLENAIFYLRRNAPGLLPTDAEERKKIPLSTGVLDYFPQALIEIAKVSYAGNEQHNPGQRLHWARGKSTDQADTMQRHFAERGGIDTDGQRHTAKMAWRALAMLQLELEEAGAPKARGAKEVEEGETKLCQ